MMEKLSNSTEKTSLDTSKTGKDDFIDPDKRVDISKTPIRKAEIDPDKRVDVSKTPSKETEIDPDKRVDDKEKKRYNEQNEDKEENQCEYEKKRTGGKTRKFR